MNIHKNTRLTIHDRKEIWRKYSQDEWKVTRLSQYYRVSRPTIYNVLKKARLREFVPRDSTNTRFKQMRYGIKRLAKVEKSIQEKLKKQAKRYNKSYPGELMHFDTKRLPLLKGQTNQSPRQYLFVAIDDYSRELYASIEPDKTQLSSSAFLGQVLYECPYTIDYTYSDNGKEYKGSSHHEFVKLCSEHGIGQKFTRCNRPQTNGKAERVIRTLMEMWHNKEHFESNEERRKSLNRFINFYNTVKPHKSLNGDTPYEILEAYFSKKV